MSFLYFSSLNFLALIVNCKPYCLNVEMKPYMCLHHMLHEYFTALKHIYSASTTISKFTESESLENVHFERT